MPPAGYPKDLSLPPVVGVSEKANGVFGKSEGENPNAGVYGVGEQGPGVTGWSTSGAGVEGTSEATYGVYGESTAADGVHGLAHHQAPGVWGENDGPATGAGPGVYGKSAHWEGVHGDAQGSAAGVAGVNHSGDSKAAGPGVWGGSTFSYGVYGGSANWEGVHGDGHGKGAGVCGVNDSKNSDASAAGVWGSSERSQGVYGRSTSWEGVHGDAYGKGAGVVGMNLSTDPGGAGPGVYGQSTHGDAGFFNGNVTITGHLAFGAGADCAEQFDVVPEACAEPGTVMVLNSTGALAESEAPYDNRVAGVISGAGDYQPGIVLDSRDSSAGRAAIALVGKAYCKVDADIRPIHAGDLLTTSATPGFAMAVSDPTLALGAVIGKALRPLAQGRDLIPILVTLR